jgi:alpha-amylase
MEPDGGQPASIHDIVHTKEAGLAAQLHYDPFERRSALVRFLDTAADRTAWADGDVEELGDAVDGAFELEVLELDRLVVSRLATVQTPDGRAKVQVRKELRLSGDWRAPCLAVTVTVENRSSVTVEARLGLEWTLTMLGGGGNPAAWWDVAGERAGHDTAGDALGVTELSQGNDHLGVGVATSISPPADAWWAPVETISNSEGGFERVYQGGGLLLSWPIALTPSASWWATVEHRVTTARDRDAEERGTADAVAVGV